MCVLVITLQATCQCLSTHLTSSHQLFSLILLLIGLILGAVGTGLDEWSRLKTERSFPDSERSGTDGSTTKTQGLLRRCISYSLTNDLRGRPSDEVPDDSCIDMEDLDCSLARDPLVSALDDPDHDEIHNSNDEDECDDSKPFKMSVGVPRLSS